MPAELIFHGMSELIGECIVCSLNSAKGFQRKTGDNVIVAVEPCVGSFRGKDDNVARLEFLKTFDYSRESTLAGELQGFVVFQDGHCGFPD